MCLRKLHQKVTMVLKRVTNNYVRKYERINSSLGYSTIVLSVGCDVGSANLTKISGHMTSGEQEFLIHVSAGFWREL